MRVLNKNGRLQTAFEPIRAKNLKFYHISTREFDKFSQNVELYLVITVPDSQAVPNSIETLRIFLLRSLNSMKMIRNRLVMQHFQ